LISLDFADGTVIDIPNSIFAGTARRPPVHLR
jgi:hypothetical protein